MCSTKMGFRILIFAVLLAVALQYTSAAPRPNAVAVSEKQEVMQRFAEFLHQDKEFLALMDQNFEPLRNKREAAGEVDGMNTDDFDVARKEPGFFDRAAKFVTEMLQRFLKWINSADDN